MPGSDRRALGIYYTPHSVSNALCEWAVRESTDRVLEPSFGGCVFLVEAATALRELGAKRPFEQLYGCDIDTHAFVHLRNAFPRRKISSRFVRRDFLSLAPAASFTSSVTAVVGNPPYVSNHNMTLGQRASARRSAACGPLQVRSTASLWAHFVNHSLRFLSDQGRLAMVLPGTAFRTDYGQGLLPQLSRRFRRVDIIHLQERVFAKQGIRDMPAILLCDGWNDTASAKPPIVHTVSSVEACSQRITALRSQRAHAASNHDSRMDSAMSVFRRVGQCSLGDLATIKIGLVTGANHFFALRPSDCRALELPNSATLPFLSQVSLTPALELAPADLRRALKADERCLLLNPPEGVTHLAVLAYLTSFAADKRSGNRTFSKRPCWYRPLEGSIPDAFLSYMNSHSPRLILNGARTQSLNNIHRLYFRPQVTKAQKRLAALAMLSTVGQLASEVLGRTYGGGVLKLEPSDAARLPIPGCARVQGSQIAEAWKKANTFLRTGAHEAAVAIADALVVASMPGLDESLRGSKDLLKSLRRDRLSAQFSSQASRRAGSARTER
jgi:adenine-specific DNA-methyltransferase